MIRAIIAIGALAPTQAIGEPLGFYDYPLFIDRNGGTAILKNFLITTDFNQHASWLQPVGRSK